MSERQQGRLFARQIWVSAFLDLERQRMVQRTDEAIRANLPNLTLAALELAQCLDGRNASHASRGFQFTKPPSPRSLRKWLKAFETDQLFGLADRADRRGNRTRAICHVGLGWMMKAVCGYMHPDRPTIKMIENKVKEAFDDGNAARAAQGLPIIRVPSRETVRRAIRNLEPFQVKLHRDGAAAARKMFAPVGKGLLRGRPEVVGRLCYVAGQELAPLWRNTASSLGNQQSSLRGETIPASMLVREEARFCPLCLHEDDVEGDPAIVRRDRLAWSLRVVTTCPRHDLALILRARDHREMAMHKTALHVPEQGDQLVTLAARGTHRKPSPLQCYVLDRLDGRRGPDWLDSQSLEQAVKGTQMLGVTMAFGASVKLGSVDRDGWDLAGRCGWAWTSVGAPGLQEAFRRLQAAAFAENRGGQNYFTVFGQLYSWLREPGGRTDHGPIKDLLRDYIVQEMDVCVGRDLLGKPVRRRNKYSVQSLALETGLHRQTLCKVLVEQGLISDLDAGRPNSILLVDKRQVRAVAAALSNSVQFVHLPKLLNATRPVISLLIELGMLSPLRRGSGPNSRDRCGFDPSQVRRLADRIHRLAPERLGLPADRVTLNQCTKRARVPMKQLLKLILRGAIEGIGRNSGKTGFRALRLDIDEVHLLIS